jgi:hypothetical protein
MQQKNPPRKKASNAWLGVEPETVGFKNIITTAQAKRI